jgi:DNA-binding NtrC family response regulator
MATILIVEDEAGIRQGLLRAVQSAGHVAIAVAGVGEARRALRLLPDAEAAAPDPAVPSIDCVLLDLRLRDGDGLTLLGEIRKEPDRAPPVIIATAYGDSERTIAAMKEGAFDYVTKPFDLGVLLDAVERALRQRQLAQTTPREPAVGPAPEGMLVGQSAAMLAVWKIIGRAASSTAPVLITGETGTGKELLARAIHQHSFSGAAGDRGKAPFIAVNLAALPPTLVESELFGHEKGAFTGATGRRAGRLELATGGTLFLDEIGDLDASLQTKLLRVLQDGSYERVGGAEPLTSQARIIAATHKQVRPGQPGAVLREDLYYRLAVIEIELPPLRARKSDIPLLVAHALRTTPARALSEDAMACILSYGWPGNVRELFHVLTRTAILCGGEIIDVGDLPPAIREPGPKATPADPYESLPLREALASLERHLIERALVKANGNRAEAARILGIARPQLYAKMEEHGISRPDRPDRPDRADRIDKSGG